MLGKGHEVEQISSNLVLIQATSDYLVPEYAVFNEFFMLSVEAACGRALALR
jgi:hypothetical protein